MFVIKATHKDETRRLAFEGTRFPSYGQVQLKLRNAFKLPSTAHTFWTHVLFYPDDAQEARIMFKRHVCDAHEYETAQKPFLRSPFPAPALVFTVLLNSDPRMEVFHNYHRASTLMQSTNDIAVHIATLEEDYAKRSSLLSALEYKYEQCKKEDDKLGATFWGDRVREKTKAVKELEKELNKCKDEQKRMDGEMKTNLRTVVDSEERDSTQQKEQTQEEIAAWIAGNDEVTGAFPPLESVLQPRGSKEGLKELVHKVTDASGQLLPAQEIKTMLDGFLLNLSNQLAQTFDADHHMPRRPSRSVQAQTQTTERERPAAGLGKGGFRHKHISCDGCLTGIRGMRYKCENCADYDLCGSCLPLLHSSNLHPSSHTFRAMLHTGLKERIRIDDATDRHHATCDLCSQSIVGVRWKCLNCPDWDCCASCSVTVGDTHPGHSFVKLNKSSDIVYGSHMTAREEAHVNIICDGCDKHIYGTRYKCMHPDCPNYDLCEKCESSPFAVHDKTHPMLKTKVAIPIQPGTVLDRASLERGRHGDAFGHRRGGSWTQYQSPRRCGRARDVKPEVEAEEVEHSIPGAFRPASTPSAVPATNISEVNRNIMAIVRDVTEAVGRATREGVATAQAELAKAQSDVYRDVGEAGKNVEAEVRRALSTAHTEVNKARNEAEKEVKRAHEEVTGAVDAAWREIVGGIGKREMPVGAKETEVEQAWTAALQQEDEGQSTGEPIVEAEKKVEEPAQVKEERAPSPVPCAYIQPTTPTPVSVSSFTAAAPAAASTIASSPLMASKILKEPVTPLDICSWVRHVTIAPGTILLPGAEFTKSWKLKHFASGSEYDGQFEVLTLKHCSNGELGAACKTLVQIKRADIEEDDEVVISIEGLKVPEEHNGNLEVVEFWRFVDENDVAYGQPLRIRFGIQDDSPEMSLESSTVVLPNPSPVYPGTPVPEVQDSMQHEKSVALAPKAPVESEVDSDHSDMESVSYASPRSNASSLFDLVEAGEDARTGTSIATDDIDDDFDFVDESTDDGL